MKLTCRKCGVVSDLLQIKIEKKYLFNGGYHLQAYCASCGSYITNLQHSKPQVLHFGKYKKEPIAVIAKKDAAYLRWLANQDIKSALKQSIQEELERLDVEEPELFSGNKIS